MQTACELYLVIHIPKLYHNYIYITDSARHGEFKYDNILHKLAIRSTDELSLRKLEDLINLLNGGQCRTLLCQKDREGNTPTMRASTPAAKYLLECADSTKSGSYYIPSPPTVLIMYTTQNRDGAEEERENLVKVLPEFEVEPIIKENLTRLEMLEAIRDAQRRDRISALVVIIMTHGAQGTVQATDRPVAINEIMLQMNSECLDGKPKVGTVLCVNSIERVESLSRAI